MKISSYGLLLEVVSVILNSLIKDLVDSDDYVEGIQMSIDSDGLQYPVSSGFEKRAKFNTSALLYRLQSVQQSYKNLGLDRYRAPPYARAYAALPHLSPKTCCLFSPLFVEIKLLYKMKTSRLRPTAFI